MYVVFCSMCGCRGAADAVAGLKAVIVIVHSSAKPFACRSMWQMRSDVAQRDPTWLNAADAAHALSTRISHAFLLLPLRRLITPFAGIRIVAGVVVQTLFGASFIGAAELRAAIAHDGRRIRLTLRRQSSRR
jgi:hypothetical protein